jgi:hypothetical protein
MDEYNAPKSVTVVFSVSDALKDSTTWDFTLAGAIIVDGEKDAFYNALTGPGNGYLQIRSFAFNENGKPVDDADLSAKIWTAWDNEWFYLYEEVMDDTLSGNAADVWNDDCLELKIDPQPTDSMANSVWDTRLTALGMASAGVVAADSLNTFWNWPSNGQPSRAGVKQSHRQSIIFSAWRSTRPTTTAMVGRQRFNGLQSLVMRSGTRRSTTGR